MTIEQLLEQNKEWMTKTDFHYEFRVPYSAIKRAIDQQKITVKLSDDSYTVLINVEEARRALGLVDLFS